PLERSTAFCCGDSRAAAFTQLTPPTRLARFCSTSIGASGTIRSAHCLEYLLRCYPRSGIVRVTLRPRTQLCLEAQFEFWEWQGTTKPQHSVKGAAPPAC